MSKQIVKLFTNINKVDDEKRMVYGYASTGVLDSQGDIITTDAMEKAFPDYMKFANIREMHTDSAVGIVKEFSFDENGTFIGVEVVDDNAWKKVKKGVYKGFSIGGAVIKKIGNTITDLLLVEISLVDRPANPLALITEYKSESIDKLPSDLISFAKKYDADIPDAEIIEKADTTDTTDGKDKDEENKDKKDDKNTDDNSSNDNEENTEDKDKDEKEKEAKKSKMLEDLEKSGLSIDDILELVNKSKKEKEDKEAEELAKKQEALLAKGFYDVQDVLSAISALNWVLDSQEWESKWENDDNSEILTSIRDHILSLVDLAKQIMDNEVKDLSVASPEIIELSEKMNTMKAYSDSLPKVNKEVEKPEGEDLNKSSTNTDLSKSLDEKDIEISALKEELSLLKKNATFDNKSDIKNVSKTITTNIVAKSASDIVAEIDNEIVEVKEKISKSVGEEKSQLEGRLASLKISKSQMTIFNK